MLALLLCCAGGWANARPDRVAPPASDYGTRWSKTEKWVWDRLKAGEIASLDDRCADRNLDPSKDDKAEPHWLDPCRQVSGNFLHDVLTDARWKEAMPHQGVLVVGAHIVGDLDLESAELVREILIGNSRIDDGFTLLRVRTKSLIGLSGTFVRHQFDANALNSESDLLLLDGTTFGQGVDLRSAKVAGQVSLIGAGVTDTLDADGLQTGNLLMRSDDKHQASFQDVRLVGAKVAGQVTLVGANVTGTLNADALQAGNLYMYSDAKHQASFQDVILRGAKVAGQVALVGATVTGTFKGDEMQVGQSLYMRSEDNAHPASFPGGISLIFARIDDGLDLRGAVLTDVDLSGAAVGGELEFGTSGDRLTAWIDMGRNSGSLNLQNAHIGSLADEKEVWQLYSHPQWPALQLDGLTISHLGGFASGTAVQMRKRGAAWWDAWARLDTQYSPAPYTQLANAFVAMGDRDAANEIRFFGRVRERAAMKGWPWFAAMALEYVAGFGIGGYTFRVLYWIAGFTAAGAALLWLMVPAARMGHRGLIWCFGASLSRLLPIIEINKEFTDFFDDPERIRLKGWQMFAFSVLGAVGWILGGILIAAVSGLTQNP